MLPYVHFVVVFLLNIPAISAARSSVLTLLSCLTDHRLTVELPTDPTWTNSTTPYDISIAELPPFSHGFRSFNTRFSYSPSAIVYPNQTADVSKAVTCAVASGVHWFFLMASGYGSQNGTLVVSFRNMAQIAYNPTDTTVSIGPGARLGDVAWQLDTDYGRALAHGLCPYVGVGGHTAFGGWGLASRNWGLLIDQLLSAVLVLADGSVVHVSATQSPDLFWAICGAASSFGIVTQYTFQTHWAPATVVRYEFFFEDPTLSSAKFAELSRSYQAWGLTAQKEVGIVANIIEGERCLADFKPIAASLLHVTGLPNNTYLEERAWPVVLAEVGEGIPNGSLVVPTSSPLTTAAFSALAEHFANTPIPGTTSWFIQFELWGGGDSLITSLPSTATAYPHRAHLWTIQFYDTAFITGMVSAMTESMPDAPFAAYANYLDPELTGWQNKYYAGNYPKLAALQKKFDPKGVFLKDQNIGAPDL
ncbi:hypothetical protein B0H17DRAFT_1280421 [Mycena rosella]|uniref:FAD-binding PCMH-type domain-containing protein n=1 Tax=Mycena rosella TaxID=1033263 RepID=A0AAD7FRP8_MYCRO|nr:hypothetical protein B0H17DRAFT_1280421 [Mycena rosella]